ncbi:hypothetical protein [Ureibacillus manganicus]|uniref:Potassium transporter n=1 Tax=Ureibacillus manganicus DSM 26584 TaxID=1384049 RepID=A0A0A3I4B0_9BACL|nr:hypothetical protein [Ureibacillus manganicus]KGR79641.1 hypothetical protein CD29_05960 [Ureibacillus manganicus DSM 26584]
MNLSSSKNTQIILLVALIAALIFAVYYYLVLPKQSEVDALNRSINSLNTEISTIQEQIGQEQAARKVKTSSALSLRKKMPNSRKVDELLLNIEEIEYVTDSLVLSISFNDYDSSAQDAGIGFQNEEETTTDPNAQNTTETTEGETGNENASPFNLGMDLPPELKMISFSMQVQSPDYNRLLQFIDEIEKLERIMHVDSINFSLPGEDAEFNEDASDIVTASIQVTTFYYEGE